MPADGLKTLAIARWRGEFFKLPRRLAEIKRYRWQSKRKTLNLESNSMNLRWSNDRMVIRLANRTYFYMIVLCERSIFVTI